MKRGEVFFAVAAKELYVAKRLGVFIFNSKAAVFILNIVGGSNDVIGYFKKFRLVATVGAFEQIADFWLVK